MDWCQGQPDCEDPARLCKDLEDDFHAFSNLKKKYPSKFKVVRYEDFSSNLEAASREVLQFLGLPHHKNLGKHK